MSDAIERTIAGKARELVEKQQKTDEVPRGEYKSLCESFPVLMRQAGLAQTVAFLVAKKGHPHATLYNHLEQQFRAVQFLGTESLAEMVTSPKLSTAQYRLYSAIAMKAALWHKRLAQALLEKSKT